MELSSSLGIKTKLSGYTENYQRNSRKKIQEAFIALKLVSDWRKGVVKPEDAKRIVEMACLKNSFIICPK